MMTSSGKLLVTHDSDVDPSNKRKTCESATSPWQNLHTCVWISDWFVPVEPQLSKFLIPCETTSSVCLIQTHFCGWVPFRDKWNRNRHHHRRDPLTMCRGGEDVKTGHDIFDTNASMGICEEICRPTPLCFPVHCKSERGKLAGRVPETYASPMGDG